MKASRLARTAVAAIALTGAVAVSATAAPGGTPGAPEKLKLEETTIGSIQKAFASGDLTCKELVRSYLRRIATYDVPRGDDLATNAVAATNREAMREAARLDRTYRQSGPTGPLHCVPVLVKDQVETEQMPTTYGSAIFEDHWTGRDATIVTRMREAGAIMLAKTNLGEFASGWAGSGFGVCRNPYDLEHAASSSSCGTGAGIAANYGAIGIAEDTGGSTRGPAAWNNAVGLRPTTPLISRHGAMPAAPSFDTLGPLTRTVEDAALLTNVIAGYDPHDALTAEAIGNVEDNYADSLDTDDLSGKRVGVVRDPMTRSADPSTPDYARVEAVVADAFADLEALGAEVVEIELPSIVNLLSKVNNDVETNDAINAYLDTLPNSPVQTFEEIATSEVVTPTRRASLLEALAADGDEEARAASEAARDDLRALVSQVMDEHDLDAISYPTFAHESPAIPADQLTNPDSLDNVLQGSNRSLAPAIGYPALAVPAGFTSAGLPVGIEFLGQPWSEEMLFEMGYAYEQGTGHRRPPEMTAPRAGH